MAIGEDESEFAISRVWVVHEGYLHEQDDKLEIAAPGR